MDDFSDWLKQAKITDDAAGDLLADLRGDSRGFAGIETFEALENRIALRGGCAGAREAAPDVWRRYAEWLRRKS